MQVECQALVEKQSGETLVRAKVNDQFHTSLQ